MTYKAKTPEQFAQEDRDYVAFHEAADSATPSRNVNIGLRKSHEITQGELGSLIYELGYCASSEYWDKPIFSIWDTDEKDNSVFYQFTQSRFCDGILHSTTGHFRINMNESDRLGYGITLYNERHGSGTITFRLINRLIKMGFDLPIKGVE